jgi:PAS domain S-box-containing protein
MEKLSNLVNQFKGHVLILHEIWRVIKQSSKLRQFFAAVMIIVMLALVSAVPSASATGTKQVKKVLLIHSFEPYLPYSITINQSIRSAMEADETFSMDFYTEYLDLARYSEEEYPKRLLEILRYKYFKKNLDLVFVMLNPALDFVTKHSWEIFSDIPIVFCTIEEKQIQERGLSPNITGVFMQMDPKGTLEAALRLQPDTRKVIVIGGIHPNDKVYENTVRQAFKEYESRLDISYLTDMSLGAILASVRTLPKNTIVLYITMFQDGTGKALVPRDVLAAIARTSNVPVYAMLESYMGHGVVGGHIVSFEEQGKKAANIGLRVLHGEKPAEIEISPADTNVYMFDWRQIKRWGMNEQNLPPQSTVLFRKLTVWDEHKWKILGVVVFCLIESLLIAILLIQRATRRKIEDALRESERKYRNIFENALEGIFQTTPDGLFISANPALSRMCGFDSPQEMMKSVTNIAGQLYVNPEDRIKLKVLHENQMFVEGFETQIYNKNSEKIWVSLNERSVLGAKGELLYYEGTIEDITARKHLESQLRQSQKMEAIGTLAGGVAHDFNNILTAITGYGNLLQMDIGDDIKRRHYAEQILVASKKAANLTQSLLAFSRKQTINPKPCKLNDILQSIEKLLRRLITEDIEFKIVFADPDVTIMADANQMDQVLMNLTTNARDAMSHGGSLTIEAKSVFLEGEFLQNYGFGKPGQHALISITDTGIGMDEKTREKIFEPFFTTKEVGKGTGLGLSIVYGIVKQHDGHINIYSEPGKGTVCKIYIPAIKTQAEELRLPDRDVKGGTETILLAEDNDQLRNLTKEVLLANGYTVIETNDGEQAIERFIKNKDIIDILILDVVMPKKNGKDVYDAVQKLKTGIKVLFTSGYTGDIVLNKGICNGEANFISKPFSPNDLLLKVREILDK